MVDPDALPDRDPPLADPEGVPVGTTVPPEPPEISGSAGTAVATPGAEGTVALTRGGVPPPLGLPPVQAGITNLPAIDMAEVSAGLAEIQRRRTDANENIYSRNERQIQTDQDRVQRAYEAAGIGPGDLQPWDAAGNRERYRTDPIAEFGNIGSVFAIIASAFTNRPMENAMMGSAAAINAARAGNDQEFNRAYRAWTDNTNLAIRRQGIQHQRYGDAVNLMNSNMAAGQAMVRINAERYGDQQMLFLAEQGLVREQIELVERRNNMALRLQQTIPALTLQNVQINDLLADPNFQAGGERRQRAMQLYHARATGRYDEDLEFSNRWWNEQNAAYEAGQRTSAPTATEFATAFGAFKRQQRAPVGGLQGAELQRRTQMYQGAPYNMEETAAFDRASREITAARSVQTEGRTRDEMVRARAEEIRTESNNTIPLTEARIQASRDVRLRTAAPSGNRLDDIQAARDRIAHMQELMRGAEDIMARHSLITGIGGSVTRPAEVLGNITGISNETDRRQFQHLVAEMRELGPRVLVGSNGRPLAAEMSNINLIVPGMSPGDTWANTGRQFRELERTLQGLDQRLGARAGPAAPSSPASSTNKPRPEPPSNASPGSAGGAAGQGQRPWERDPIRTPAGQRSDIPDESMEMTG